MKKQIKEEIELEALKTTYPLALARGIRIGKLQTISEVEKLIEKIKIPSRIMKIKMKTNVAPYYVIYSEELKSKLKEMK